ncbi:hypothetical protein CPB83DRAFT_80138 [Crepidotus variabilis]|uniref:RING-type domain-containing protein n=1 Tax=Crepidotus variabilis TaxID=179855 RepID=A0A9P6EKW9_9AGAR|nr:hypothetical protein CPB83DRAFT_80138 [Crepidotus variabilis]
MRPSGVLFVVSVLVLSVFCYVPAVPTNDTEKAIAGGLNITEVSKLYMLWSTNGSYSENVSYQLMGNGSDGITKGVLVHFSEEIANNLTEPTATPWIAFVSCDRNATNQSLDEDIFTLARDKGAVAAVLYSLDSVACIINPEYADPNTFDQVFDIYSTESKTSAHLIDYQFGQLSTQQNTKNVESILNYDSKLLNDSRADIEESVRKGYAVSPGYLLGMLHAYNATGNFDGPGMPGQSSAPPSANKSPSTALAMIVLYAITGCVSALFIVVIISGAVRALRHPERYGPRHQMGRDGAPPQSRAKGLTRAILDTFPLVKFGSPDAPHHHPDTLRNEKDLEQAHLENSNSFEMSSYTSPLDLTSSGEPGAVLASSNDASFSSQDPKSAQTSTRSSQHPNHPPIPTQMTVPDNNGEGSSKNVSNPSSQPSTRPPTAGRNEADDVVPASIGRDTCPICIVDFEEGDDIRVLPCDGKHCFHQQCVDPWLLKLSSSCPICRHDFLALENMIAGNVDDNEDITLRPPQRPHSNAGRFSRYLRFARTRHREPPRRLDEIDPTDPSPDMPVAPETTL